MAKRQDYIRPKKHNYKAVVSIDFGTTFSGFAFCFNKEFKTGERGIHMCKQWDNPIGPPTLEAPTCVLLNKDKTFNSFGYDAKEKYAELSADDDKDMYYYFDKFKMMLHNENQLSSKTELTAANGRKVKALDVFSLAIAYLKDRALELLNQTIGAEFPKDDIQWVLTVPAIWTQSSKQFMKDAASEAGLLSRESADQLVIALEPEAASYHCLQTKMRDYVDGQGSARCCDVYATPGSSYMVVDCGGGTVDITTHTIADNKKLEELHRPVGGPYGGTTVDEAFEKLLKDILGEPFIDEFKTQYPSDWLALIIDFEMKKHGDRALKGEATRIRIPSCLPACYEKKTSEKITKWILEKYPGGEIKFSRDLLVFSSDVMKSLFRPAIEGIIRLINELLSKPELKDAIKSIFMVGGLSESKLLQKAVRERFESKYRVLVPQDASLAVVKGAILFGQNPGKIQTRICSRTYGIEACVPFDDSIHDVGRVIESGDESFVPGVFHKLVQVNDKIHVGKEQKYTFQPVDDGQSTVRFLFYSTSEDDATYVDEENVRAEGEIVIESPDTETDREREIDLMIEFADTEIKVTAIDRKSGINKLTHLEMTSD